jgi:hypothetical protein
LETFDFYALGGQRRCAGRLIVSTCSDLSAVVDSSLTEGR